MTWFQLWAKLGKQPIKKTQRESVMLKDGDDFYSLKLVYSDDGSHWWLKKEREKENESMGG